MSLPLQRRLISIRDLAHVGLLLVLALPAWFMPRTTWLTWGKAIGKLIRFQGRGRLERIRQAMGDAIGERDAVRIDEAITAEGVLARIYLLHEYRIGARPPALELVGAEHIDAALARGHGAILWVTPFCSADLMTKRAIHEAGYVLTHLSRPEHGGGPTRLGVRLLSPVYQTIENRFLGRRLLLRGSGGAALRQLVAALSENALVSIAALETAARTVRVPFLASSILLARGPVALARRSRAPLLPVFTVRPGPNRFQVTVLPPLTFDDADAAAPFAQYARALQERVRTYPGQWAGWRSVAGLERSPGAPAA